MARPREFDEVTVLRAALGCFWAKGYEATSVEDLVQATGLSRASLYGAFGDKERLFARVVDFYLAEGEAYNRCDAAGSARAALAALATKWVEGMCSRKGQRGCFLSLSALDGASPEFARAALLRSTAQREQALTDLIARGQAAGELRTDRDAAALAQFLIVLQQGLSASARLGLPQRDLALAMGEAIEHVIGSVAPGPSAAGR
jgi:TetR/AcrR family transcriptional regulator, transcriptional repressor for nem operon